MSAGTRGPAWPLNVPTPSPPGTTPASEGPPTVRGRGGGRDVVAMRCHLPIWCRHANETVCLARGMSQCPSPRDGRRSGGYGTMPRVYTFYRNYRAFPGDAETMSSIQANRRENMTQHRHQPTEPRAIYQSNNLLLPIMPEQVFDETSGCVRIERGLEDPTVAPRSRVWLCLYVCL